MTPFCFRLEATRGPHSDAVHRYCWEGEHPTSPSSSSTVRLLSIGRKKRCSLRLTDDLEVSSFHAELRFLGDGDGGMRLVLRDARSTNGTKVNGKPLKPQQDYELSSGDLIGVGRTSLRFVKVKHQEPCGDQEEDATAVTVLTTTSSSMAPAPEVIVLDEDSMEEALPAPTGELEMVSVAGAAEVTTTDQPDTEPAQDEVQKQVKKVVGGGEQDKEGGKVVVVGLKKSKTVKKGGAPSDIVNEFTPEEATCTVCSVVIGQLDMLEQQAHLNECLGGRIAAKTVDADTAVLATSTASKDAKPTSRKRGNAGGVAARAKKPRKPKAGEAGDSAPKVKKPRKRKRVGDTEDIELAFALAPTAKMTKEEQTDMQLAAAKKKLEELDAQMAKLAKRRVNLVKTLGRLERTKEKLRKSQVLPPAKVQQFLDLNAALNVIFPNNQQAQADQHESIEEKENVSFVAKRYAPSRWIDSEMSLECEDEKQAELAAVAAISMWARASQQLYGLQRDTLLYRNSVLRAFLSDDEDVDINSIELVSTDDVDNEDPDADIEREEESGTDAVLPSMASDAIADEPSNLTRGVDEVPDVVKRVFPNWQQDLAFLQEQTAEEIEMALEAMRDAVKRGGEVVSDADVDQGEVDHTNANDEPIAGEPSVASSKNSPSINRDQQRACELMAQVMTYLIAEKRRRSMDDANGCHELQPTIDLAGSSSENSQEVGVVEGKIKEPEAKLHSSPEELPNGQNATNIVCKCS